MQKDQNYIFGDLKHPDGKNGDEINFSESKELIN